MDTALLFSYTPSYWPSKPLVLCLWRAAWSCNLSRLDKGTLHLSTPCARGPQSITAQHLHSQSHLQFTAPIPPDPLVVKREGLEVGSTTHPRHTHPRAPARVSGGRGQNVAARSIAGSRELSEQQHFKWTIDKNHQLLCLINYPVR